jgi:hypothetical protein
MLQCPLAGRIEIFDGASLRQEKPLEERLHKRGVAGEERKAHAMRCGSDKGQID